MLQWNPILLIFLEILDILFFFLMLGECCVGRDPTMCYVHTNTLSPTLWHRHFMTLVPAVDR